MPNTRVIVKSGVQEDESSGGLIDFCHLDAIFELHSGNDLGQVIEPAQASPLLLGTLTEFGQEQQLRQQAVCKTAIAFRTSIGP
jgi:hypothetical protein